MKTNCKTYKKKIIVVGGGVVESEGDRFFIRSQLFEYLLGLRNFYEKVTWSVRMADSRDYQTEIDPALLDLDVINKDGESFFSIKGVWGLLMHYLFFVKMLNRKTDVIVSNYSTTSIGYLFLTRLLGGKSLFYLGSDPKLTINMRKGSFYDAFASRLNVVLLPVCLDWQMVFW